MRLLFVLVGAGGHNIEVNTPPLLQTMDTLGGFQVTLLAPPKGKPGDAAHLATLAKIKRADYDVLVFYTTASRLDPAAEKAIQSFVEQGGGLVALHGASGSFTNSKTWFQLVGGRFAGHAIGTYQLVINKAWSNPSFQKLVLQGIYWTAGRPKTVVLPDRKGDK